MDGGAYIVAATITGTVVFVIAWIYAIAEYGFLLGVGLGWLPAGIIGVVAGIAWPLIALAVAGLAYLAFVA